MDTPGMAHAFSDSTRCLRLARIETPPVLTATVEVLGAKPSLGDRGIALVGIVASSTTMALSACRAQAPPILALVGHPVVADVVELAGAIGVKHGRRMVLLKVEGRARLPCGGEFLVERLGLGLNAFVLVVIPWVPPV